MARAIHRLKESLQPSRFGHGPEISTLEYLAPHAGFEYALAMANLWLFEPLVKGEFSSDYRKDALHRTTTAVTIVEAGYKENVIPNEAKAVINHRIHPADNVMKVIDINKKIGKKKRCNEDDENRSQQFLFNRSERSRHIFFDRPDFPSDPYLSVRQPRDGLADSDKQRARGLP